MSLRTRIASALLKAASATAGISGTELATILGANARVGTRLGTKELLLAFNTMPWLRAVVGKVGYATAAVPWQLFAATAKPAKGGRPVKHAMLRSTRSPFERMKMYKALRADDSLKEITDHPALVTLDKGNARMTGHQVRELTQQYLDLSGETGWVLERNGLKLPSEIYPVPPTWITGMPGQSGRDVYTVMMPGGTREIPPDDFIYFYHPNPADPYGRGTGTGHSLGDELETDEEAAKHLKMWFKNRARPDILVTGPGLRAEEAKRLEENWIGKLSGAKGVNRPHFINREVKVDILSQTFQEMQLSELRKDERDIIIHTYGVPPEVFGILETSNRATIDAADYLMAKYVMVPRLEFQRAILQRRLVDLYDDRLILDYISPVMADREYELKVMMAQPAAFTVDEWREAASRPPLDGDGGDGHLAPTGVLYVEALDELGAAAMGEPMPGMPGSGSTGDNPFGGGNEDDAKSWRY